MMVRWCLRALRARFTRAIVDQLLLTQKRRNEAGLGETRNDGLAIGAGDLGLLAEAALALRRLLGQDVALIGLGAHELAGAGNAETLLGTAVRLHLGHGILLYRLQDKLLLIAFALLGLLVESALDGSEEHEHVAALELGLRLDRGIGLEVLRQALEHVETLLRMRHLATAEHDGDLHARALLEEAEHVTLLGLVVADVDLGTELHLLDLDARLVLARCLGLHGLLVLVLTIVHDAAYGRIGVRSDLDEVEVLLVGDALRVANVEEPQLRAIDTDQAAPRRGDLVIDARVIVLSYFRYLLQNTKPGAMHSNRVNRSTQAMHMHRPHRL